jgi:hypothetical protein
MLEKRTIAAERREMHATGFAPVTLLARAIGNIALTIELNLL